MGTTKSKAKRNAKRPAQPGIQKTAEQMLAYWKYYLHLTDWNIRIKVVEDAKDCDEALGVNQQHPAFQESFIRVLDPNKIPEDWMFGCRDMEVTIVHELLHTRFIYCIPRGNKKENPGMRLLAYQEELAIETTAKALVANRRGVRLEDLS